MRIFIPFAKTDAEQREVWGYASTEARDDQGEIVKREALEAALGDYMRFANIREMHQLSAVGIAKEAAVDDKGLYVGAKIIDEPAWEKVRAGVYKGYSIGGRVTERDPTDYKTITGIVLSEISLVDRPANPEAVFDVWKSGAQMTEAFNPPIQIWACGSPEHRHLAKADAMRCMAKGSTAGALDQIQATIDGAYAAAAEAEEAAARAEAIALAAKGGDDPGNGAKPYGEVEYADPGYQADKKKRYPIDNEKHIRAAWSYINKPKNAGQYSSAEVDKIKAKIVAAWKDKIDKDGPPEADDKAKAALTAIHKALADVGGVARVILGLDWLKDVLETEAAMEGDDSPQPARLQAIIAELCGFLNALVAEETAEVIEGDEIDPRGGDIQPVMPVMLSAIAETLRKSGKGELAVKLEKASRHEAAMLHMAHHAVAKAVEMPGLSDEKLGHLHAAKLSLAAAGADGDADEHSTEDTANNPTHPAPTTGGGDPTGKAARLAVAALAKHGGHQALMDVAHGCIKDATDGMTCAGGAAKAHSAEVMAHLHKAHLHLAAAGAKCDAAGEGTSEKTAAAGGEMIKALTETNALLRQQNAEQSAALAAVTASLGHLTKRVEDIANTPLPPALLARAPRIDVVGPTAPSDAEIDAAWKAMTPDDQTKFRIAASLRNPIAPPVVARLAARRSGMA